MSGAQAGEVEIDGGTSTGRLPEVLARHGGDGDDRGVLPVAAPRPGALAPHPGWTAPTLVTSSTLDVGG